MYSDYASGIAFLIKTKFNQNDTRGFEATETCVLAHDLFWCSVGRQAESCRDQSRGTEGNNLLISEAPCYFYSFRLKLLHPIMTLFG